MPDSKNSNSPLEPSPPKILQNLRWLQLNWRQYWGLLMVAALILSIPVFLKTLPYKRAQDKPPMNNDVVKPQNAVPKSAPPKSYDENSPESKKEAETPAWLLPTLADLKHPNLERQLAAVKELSTYSDSEPAARTALEKAIYHPQENVSCLSVLKLRKLADPRSLPVLINALEAGNFPYPGYLLHALEVFPTSPSIEAAARPYLKHEQAGARVAAIDLIAKAGHSSDIPMLLQLLENGHSLERGHAVRALETFGSRALLPSLAFAADAKSHQAKFALCRLLGQIGDDNAVPYLVSLLGIKVRSQISWVGGMDESGLGIPIDEGEIGIAAKEALKRIGTPKALTALTDNMQPD